MNKDKQQAGELTIKDMVDFEFNVPKIKIDAFDNEKQYIKFLDSLIYHFEKLQMQKSISMEKTHDIIDTMLIFLDKYPELFGENYGEVSRDMLKFSLYRHIDKCQKLIDKISRIEKDLNLPIH